MFLKEKSSPVFIANLDLFKMILEESKNKSIDLKLDNKVEKMIAKILDRLIDRNEANVNASYELITKTIMEDGYFDYNMIAAFLFSPKSYLMKSHEKSEKYILKRLDLIEFLLDTNE